MDFDLCNGIKVYVCAGAQGNLRVQMLIAPFNASFWLPVASAGSAGLGFPTSSLFLLSDSGK